MNEHVKAFAFLRSFDETLELLSDSDELTLVRAIRNYVFRGEDPDFASNTTLKIAWASIRASLEASVRRSKGGANSAGERPSMRGNQNARKKEEQLKNNTETTLEQQSINTETKQYNQDKSLLLAPCSSFLNNRDNSEIEVLPKNTDINGRREVGRTRESWRALSSVRRDMLGWNKDAIAEYKRELLRKEVAALGILTDEAVDAFVSKWGEHNPGDERIRAEMEDIFNVADRAKNYQHIGKEQKEPLTWEEEKQRLIEFNNSIPDGTYWQKDLTPEMMDYLHRNEFKLWQKVRRGEAIHRKDHKWNE